jgi:hypothetical protein
MKSHMAAGLLLAGSALAVASVAHADCSKDTDCKGERICISGACVDANTPPGQVPPPPGEFPPGPLPQGASPIGPPPAPEPGTVPVTFRGGEGYVVRSMLPSGQIVQCTAPCTLSLFPGTVEVEVVGEFKDVFEVPNRPATAEISFKRKGLMITGIVLAGFGVGSIALAAMLKSDYDQCVRDEGARSDALCSGKDTSTGFFIVGAVLGAAGIGMFLPGILSKTAVTVNDPAPSHAWLKNLKVGFAPRRMGGGFFSARYEF